MKIVIAKIIVLFMVVLIYIPLRIWKYYNNENLQKTLNKL